MVRSLSGVKLEELKTVAASCLCANRQTREAQVSVSGEVLTWSRGAEGWEPELQSMVPFLAARAAPVGSAIVRRSSGPAQRVVFGLS